MKLFVLFAVIAAVYSAPTENEAREKRTIFADAGIIPTLSAVRTVSAVSAVPALTSVPAVVQGQVSFEERGLTPFDEYPPGVDPITCPNYPYCGTVIKTVPTLSHVQVPAVHAVPAVHTVSAVEAVHAVPAVEAVRTIIPAAPAVHAIPSVHAVHAIPALRNLAYPYLYGGW